MYFMNTKIRLILIEMNQIFPMKQSKFKISISVDNYDEKMLKITKIATLPKSSYGFLTIKDIDSKF